MKKHYKIFIVILFANTLFGMDGVEYLKSCSFLSDFQISSKSLDLTFDLPHGVTSLGWSDIKGGVRFSEGNSLAHGVTVFITPTQETLLIGRHSRITFKPVIYKNQQKGFRIVPWMIGFQPGKDKPIITYINLSDTPMKVNEEDVEMVMDGGQWVKIENSKSLIIDKLGWDAENILKNINDILQNPAVKDIYSRDFYLAALWDVLIENGLIQTNETFFIEPPFKPYSKIEMFIEEGVVNPETLPPLCRSSYRTWLWLLALPVVAGVWFTVRSRFL